MLNFLAFIIEKSHTKVRDFVYSLKHQRCLCRIAVKIRKRNLKYRALSVELNPYTLPLQLTPPGTLAAHERFHLVLLCSHPDTVRGFPLRKTQTSTPLIKGSYTSIHPRSSITPTGADCGYRAPLTPRLHGKRRRRDLNPRAGVTDLLVFEARPFSHLGTPPYELDYNLNQDECPVLFQERYDTIVTVRSQSGAGCEADAFMNMRAELLRIQ